MKLRWFRSKRTVWFLMISIIPVLVFGVAAYTMGVGIIKDEINRTSLVSLSQLDEQISQTMTQVQQTTGQMSLQTNMQEIISIGAAPTLGSLATTNAAVRDLGSLSSSIDYIESVYLYHFDQETLLTGVGLYSAGAVRFPDWQWMPDMLDQVREKKQSFWLVPRIKTESSGAQIQVLTYIRLMPMLYDTPKAALIADLDLSYFSGMMSSFPFGTPGNVLVFTSDHEMLMHADGGTALTERQESRIRRLIQENGEARVGTTVELREASLFATVYRSPHNGWSYIMAIPSDAPNQNVQLLQRMIMATTLGLSLLALFSAYFSYNRFQKGVQHLVELLFKNGRKGAEEQTEWDSTYEGGVKLIERRISSLFQEMDEKRLQWKAQLPQLRDHFLISALMGYSETVEKLRHQHGERLDIFRHAAFAVIIIQPDEFRDSGRFREDDRSLFLFAATNIGRELLSEDMIVESVVTPRHGVLILNLPAEHTDKQLMEQAEVLRHTTKQYLKQTVTIGTGPIVDSFNELAGSYRSALSAMQWIWGGAGDEVVGLAHDAPGSIGELAYPHRTELELIAHMREGNGEGAYASFEAFVLAVRPFTLAASKTFYMQLLVSMMREFHDIDEWTASLVQRNPYVELDGHQEQEELSEWFLRELIMPLVGAVERLRKFRAQSIVEQTLGLIEEHYAHDLSLAMAAEKLGISQSHLSQLFKDEVGATFIQYVTQFRVDAAKRLLAKTELTISEIAKEVGYGNAQQLIRVFKKLEGGTPGEYRNCLKA
ncbi:AraC family transcriptional regulator [Paenibacillus sp. IB182496]|uniref:AraC family transcriptional regulator n=1 Tax=Paenibacillus sabuli TaxID=2772509 RepID=A0A927GSY2_9BACL|nr:helix-turn-helix domain-containing protein [Paenibacillus sabuli]MBD2847244.1 AraC family transcriptional regulator [Paenibacillus sabuli]